MMLNSNGNDSDRNLFNKLCVERSGRKFCSKQLVCVDFYSLPLPPSCSQKSCYINIEPEGSFGI